MSGLSHDVSPLAPTGAASEPEPSAERVLARRELPDAADELLAIVRFLTAPDGPLRQPVTDGTSSPWQEHVLLRAQERVVVVVDALLAGRLPTEREFDRMGKVTMKVVVALERL